MCKRIPLILYEAILARASEIAAASRTPVSFTVAAKKFLRSGDTCCQQLHKIYSPSILTASPKMATRSFSRALRAPLTRQLVSPTVQRRTLVALAGSSQINNTSASKRPVTISLQQSRGVKSIDFAGHQETVYGKLIRFLGLGTSS